MRKLFTTMTILLVLISFFVIVGVGFAEEYKAEDVKETKQEVQKLEKIVVEEKRIEESIAAESITAPKLEEVGHNVNIITAEEIEEGGFVDIVKAVEAKVPGFFTYARSGRAGYKRTFLHGSDKILWLLDGVRINSVGSTAYAYTLSVHMIERIEVLKGGESLFYGSDARAGAINVITKKITKETSGEFGVTYGDDEYREIFGHVTGTSDGHGLMAFGSYDASDGYHACDDQAYSDALNTYGNRRFGFDRSTLGGKYRKEFDLAGKAVLNGQLQQQTGFFDYPYPQYVYMTLSDWEDKTGILKWDHDINDTFSYYIKSYYHKWWGEAPILELDGDYKPNAYLWGFEDYGVNFMTSIRWGGGHEILTGIDYHHYEKMSKNIFTSADATGFFGQYRPYLPFAPNTKLAMGARYEKVEEDSVIWDVSMKTPIVGPTYFRGIVSTSFSLPTPTQLYQDDPANNRVANPNLTPEESFNVEVGVGGNWRYFQCDIGYFSQDIEDMIESVTLPSGVKTYENLDGTTKIDGMEVSAGIGPFSGWSFNVSTTWIDVEETDQTYSYSMPRIPDYFSKVNVGYRYPTGRFGANLMVQYTGDINEQGLSTNPDYIINSGNYCTADASAFMRFGREKRHKITLRLENIFDKEYATRLNRTKNDAGDYFIYQHYGQPRSVVVGYTYTF